MCHFQGSIYFVRRNMVETLTFIFFRKGLPVKLRSLKKRKCSHHVGAGECERILDGTVDMGLGGEVDDAVYVFILHELIEGFEVADVHLDKAIVGRRLDILEVGQISRIGQLVKVDNLILRVFVDKQTYDVAADKTCSACNYNRPFEFHIISFSDFLDAVPLPIETISILYSLIVPAGEWHGMIVCRMNPNNTENRWNNDNEENAPFWGAQTQDIKYEEDKNHYVINSEDPTWDGKKPGGSWTIYTPIQDPTNLENTNICNIYAYNGTIISNEEISIFTVTGQNVTDMNGSLKNGVYIVKSANGGSFIKHLRFLYVIFDKLKQFLLFIRK